MSTAEPETVTATDDPFATGWAWRGGAVSGLLAALVVAAVIAVMDLDLLRESVAGLYGLEGVLAAGWIAHLLHGALFGVIFALVLTDPTLHQVGESRVRSTVAGVVYGVVLAVVGAGIIMPIWLGALGGVEATTLPAITMETLTWHVVYGATLGVLYPSFEAR